MLILAFNFNFLHGTGSYASGSALQINVQNCNLRFINAPSGQSDPIALSYRIPTVLRVQSNSSVSLTSISNQANLTFVNGYNSDYCNIWFSVASTAVLDSLNVMCTNCNVMSTVDALSVTNGILINGTLVNFNMKNIKAGSFDYNALNGYVQLNNIVTTGSANSITLSERGDVVVQSIQGMTVKFTSPNNSFCFSSPYQKTNSMTDCHLANDSK